MPTTSNFGWTTPADTDLVKNGALAIRTLGNGIDTSLVDLKGGTTGQILSKASNTDLDYTWINNDQGDITEIQAGTGISVNSGTGPIPIVTNTVATAFDAKGDLIAGTGADTFAKLTVGANNTVLTADSTTATGLKWATVSGSYTLIASGTLGSSGTNLTSIAGTYRSLVLFVRNYQPSTDNTFLGLRFNNDSSANRYKEQTSNTDGLNTATAFDGTGLRASANNDNSVANGLIKIEVPDYANATTWKFMLSDSIMVNATTTTSFNYTRLQGMYNQTAAISELNLYPSSGTISGGTYALYGVA